MRKWCAGARPSTFETYWSWMHRFLMHVRKDPEESLQWCRSRPEKWEILEVLHTKVQYVAPMATVSLAMVEFYTAKSAGVQSYSLVLSFSETTPIQQKLAILNVANSTNALGDLEVLGEAQNQDDALSTYTKVAGSFYDRTGKLVYVSYTYADPSDIPLGATQAFKLTVASNEGNSRITRYSLIAESMNSRYTSIPETPWLGIFMTATLTVSIVALHRLSPKKRSFPGHVAPNIRAGDHRSHI